MALIIEIQKDHLIFTKAFVKPEGRYHIETSFMVPYQFNSPHLNLDTQQHIASLLKSKQIKDRKAYVVLGDSLVLIQQFELPRIDPKRLSFMVENEMKLALNLDDDYVYDYLVLGEVSNSEYLTDRVLAVAVKLDMIKQVEELMRTLKLRIKSIQTEHSATLNLVGVTDIPIENHPTLLFTIDEYAGSLYCYHKKEVLMIRNVTWQQNTAINSAQQIRDVALDFISMVQTQSALKIKEILILGGTQISDDLWKSWQIDNVKISTVPFDTFLACKNKHDNYSLGSIGAL